MIKVCVTNDVIDIKYFKFLANRVRISMAMTFTWAHILLFTNVIYYYLEMWIRHLNAGQKNSVDYNLSK